MVRFFGCLTPMVARLPTPISTSPSPVITATRRSGRASAKPSPTIAAQPIAAPDVEVERMLAAGGDVVSRRAEPADHQQIAAIGEELRDELAPVERRGRHR